METKVTCPKCRRSFAYRFVPMASATSIRFFSKRYMKCPLCGRFSFFDITVGLKPRDAHRLRFLGFLLMKSFVLLALLFALLGVFILWSFYVPAAVFFLLALWAIMRWKRRFPPQGLDGGRSRQKVFKR